MKYICARELIVPNRLDLMAKMTYIEARITGCNLIWAKDLYRAHIEAFSGGSFTEPGQPNKNSIEAYMNTFDELIDVIGKDGVNEEMSCIPVDVAGQIIDGAHRTSIAAYYNQKIPCIFDGQLAKNKFNYAFFKRQYLEQKYIDYMVTKYVEEKGENCYVICLYPKAMRDANAVRKVDCLLNTEISDGGVVCSKDIKMSYNGLKNFMIQAYGNHSWCGTPDNQYKGVYGKLDPCYDKCEILRAYVVENRDGNMDIIYIKKRIREIFGIENHSCHSSDCYGETLLLTHLLFNENSIHLLNHGQLDYDSNLLNELFGFKKELEKKGEDSRKYIVDSSGILGLYGIRKVRDLDYLTLTENLGADGLGSFDNHKSYVKYYGTAIDDIILNPENYLYAFGIKFITLELCKRFKQNRKEKKDEEDISLINQKLADSSSFYENIKCNIIRLKRYFRNKKTLIRDFLQRHNIYLFTKLWHFILGKGFK